LSRGTPGRMRAAGCACRAHLFFEGHVRLEQGHARPHALVGHAQRAEHEAQLFHVGGPLEPHPARGQGIRGGQLEPEQLCPPAPRMPLLKIRVGVGAPLKIITPCAGSGFGALNSGLGILGGSAQGSGLRVQGSGLWVKGSGLWVRKIRLWVLRSGPRAQGLDPPCIANWKQPEIQATAHAMRVGRLGCAPRA